MASQSPIETYKLNLSVSSFVFIVYYRGHWCHFCMSYLTQLQTISPSITSAGGSLLVVTSEPEKHIAATRKATGYQGQIIVDTPNELVLYLKQQGVLDVAISEKKGYAKGMAQPAVLVVRGGMGTEDVLERWAIVPSLMNLGGGKDRPDPVQIWENVQAKLKGEKPMHVPYTLIGALGLLKKKILG